MTVTRPAPPVSGDAANRHRIAAVQLVSGEDVAANLEAAARMVRFAAERGARLVLLPEYFAVLSSDEACKLRVAEPAADVVAGSPGRDDTARPIQRFLSALARDEAVWLVAGTIPLRSDDPDRVRNACLVYDERGRQVARYDKIHLFNLSLGAERLCESRTIEPGSEPVAVDTPVGRTALSVCYDVRFGELYRRLLPFDLLCMPAAFTATTGRAHWEVLLRARAIENQCYVLAAAQGGTHPGGRRTFGHSMIVDPWGEVLEVLPEGAGVVMADIDPQRLQQVRRDLPALANRVLT
jgi:nitrilase